MLIDPLIGRTFKEFEIIERIGHGGMAVVYRAHQASVKRDVALKVIDLMRAEDPEQFRQRFAQEARLVASLEHIHILPIYEYGIEGDLAFIAMRLLRGGTIQDLLEHGALTLDRSADLLRQAGAGLNYAHDKGVIHRDLKPSNIMLDDAGNAYLADFGLAKISGKSLELTHEDSIVGTPTYMSPEQLRGDKLSPRSDIYSLGVVLYRMLVGQLPYEASTTEVVSVIYQILETDPPRPSTVNPNIPPAVEAVILKALKKNPQDRFNSAAEMVRALDHALGRVSTASGLRVRGSSRPSITLELPTLAFVRRYFWRVLAVVLVVAIVGAGFVLSRQEETATSDVRLGHPQILQGRSELASTLIPTQAEINRAQQFLGNAGFVAHISCNLDSEYHTSYAREVRDFAAAYGLTVRVYDGKSDNYEQTVQIERARTEGAKAFTVCPVDTERIVPALETLQLANFPLIVLNAQVKILGSVRMGGDNYLLGYPVGAYAGEVIQNELGGHANVIILDYPDLEDIVARADGMEGGLLEIAPQAEVMGRYLGGTREFGKASVSKLLNDGIAFDIILSINDVGAYGAIDALKEAGYQGDEVMIFSVDAENLAQQYIQDGYFMRASINVGRTESAKAAVDVMVKMLAGSTLPESVRTDPGALVTPEPAN